MGRWEKETTHLPELLINDSELEVIADNVLVEGDNEARGLQGEGETHCLYFPFFFYFVFYMGI